MTVKYDPILDKVREKDTGTGGGSVDSVNGQTGAVVLDTGDLNEVTDKNFVTDAEKAKIGSLSLTEVEIDFGTILTPITSWTIADAAIDVSKKILVFLSPNPATDRVGNDWELDNAFFTGLAGAGNFALSFLSGTKIIGKRNIYYQVI